jgi:acyl-coenzyme A thioesterase PaaI-like protein
MTEQARWRFGEAPLPETVELATAVRDLVSSALALEEPSEEIRRITDELISARTRIEDLMPSDLRPRIGDKWAADQRVYLDHSRDIGEYNPCYPLYQLDCSEDRGEGRVEFPLLYEGPPGIVHGGFLAVLFDCVLQQLNCDLGVAGKTASLSVRYRRPTPVLTPLRITATREVGDGRIAAVAQLFNGEELLCSAEMSAVAGSQDSLPDVSPRRTS